MNVHIPAIQTGMDYVFGMLFSEVLDSSSSLEMLRSLNFSILDDDLVEGNESFNIFFGGNLPFVLNISVPVTIIDNDG